MVLGFTEIPVGPSPTLISSLTKLVFPSITETVSEWLLATYTIFVIGLIDIPIGKDSTVIVSKIKCDAGKSFLSASIQQY